VASDGEVVYGKEEDWRRAKVTLSVQTSLRDTRYYHSLVGCSAVKVVHHRKAR
jgi:hypothetical protein